MVHILMAVYNGEEYIEEQLESIVNQTESSWKLYICNDCSSDNTKHIIGKFVSLYPNQIFYMENMKNQGACGTFARLVKEVREPGDYMFCDQDDIWNKDKIAIMQSELREKEKKERKAILLYSDVSVIDSQGRKIAESFVQKSGLQLPEENVLERLLLYNFAQGAAMMWNYELQSLVTEIPEQALMHDWWMALVAAGNGEIYFVNKVLGRYRQHSANVVGAFDFKMWRKSFIKKIKISNWKRLYHNNQKLKKERICQAQAYQKLFSDKRVELFLDILQDKNSLRRTLNGVQNGYIFLTPRYSVKFYLL